MVITLNLISDIYGQPDPNTGQQPIIKKNVKYKKTFESTLIQVSSYIGKDGNILKSYCTVHEGQDSYKAICTFDRLEKIIKAPVKEVKRTIFKGFKRW